MKTKNIIIIVIVFAALYLSIQFLLYPEPSATAYAIAGIDIDDSWKDAESLVELPEHMEINEEDIGQFLEKIAELMLQDYPDDTEFVFKEYTIDGFTELVLEEKIPGVITPPICDDITCPPETGYCDEFGVCQPIEEILPPPCDDIICPPEYGYCDQFGTCQPNPTTETSVKPQVQKKCSKKSIKCGKKCCKRNQICKKGKCKKCSKGRNKCGKKCCKKGYICKKGKCKKCKKWEKQCKNKCCKKGYKCKKGRCRKP